MPLLQALLWPLLPLDCRGVLSPLLMNAEISVRPDDKVFDLAKARVHYLPVFSCKLEVADLCSCHCKLRINGQQGEGQRRPYLLGPICTDSRVVHCSDPSQQLVPKTVMIDHLVPRFVCVLPQHF